MLFFFLFSLLSTRLVLVKPALFLQNAQPSCPNFTLATTYLVVARTSSPVGYDVYKQGHSSSGNAKLGGTVDPASCQPGDCFHGSIDDIPERNLQVKRMKDIYRQAHTVFAWTGPDFAGSDLVHSLIDEALELALTSATSFESVNDFIQQISSRYDDLVWEGVIELLNRPYWRRLWIIQEIWLANTGVGLLRQPRLLDSGLVSPFSSPSTQHDVSSFAEGHGHHFQPARA